MIEQVKKVTYWAWYNDEKKVYSHIYSRRFQVEMCSPDGFKQATERREGKIVEVEICQLFEPKPDEGRLLTRSDYMQYLIDNNLGWRIEYQVSGLAVDVIAKAQRDMTASIKDIRFKELCANCDSWLWKSSEKQELVDKYKAECQERVRIIGSNLLEIIDRKDVDTDTIRELRLLGQALKKEELKDAISN